MIRLDRPSRPTKEKPAADRMAPLRSESIELPRNDRALSEPFGGAELPSPHIIVPERTVDARETTDSIGLGHRWSADSAPLTHPREAPDDYPEGGYGWVVVLACSVIRYPFIFCRCTGC